MKKCWLERMNKQLHHSKGETNKSNKWSRNVWSFLKQLSQFLYLKVAYSLRSNKIMFLLWFRNVYLTLQVQICIFACRIFMHVCMYAYIHTSGTIYIPSFLKALAKCYFAIFFNFLSKKISTMLQIRNFSTFIAKLSTAKSKFFSLAFILT